MTEPWFVNSPEHLAELDAMLRARFPTLHAFIEDGICRVRGTLPLEQNGRVFDRYLIEVILPDDYPLRPPRVWETAGRIPHNAERHTFLDGALCIGTPLALWIVLAGNFTLDRVLDIPVRNFLIGNSLVEQGEPWPHDEFSHGAEGMLEHLSELIGTVRPVMAATFLLAMADGGVTKHSPCPCQSGKKILKCHHAGIKLLRRIPAEVLEQTAHMILKEFSPMLLAA
jgi:hypothetical protein